MKKYTLKFALKNKYVFDAIKNGEKKIETRAGTVRYKNIKAGDIFVLSCGNKKFEKMIRKVSHFKSISSLVKKYSPKEINPKINTEKELTQMFFSFNGYKEKIKKFGILAFELK
jgi:ASC-1-like (ASCH) protein